MKSQLTNLFSKKVLIFRKIYRRWNIPYIWECLLLLQITILLILFLNWPVTLKFLVLESEYPYWSPLIEEFHTQNPKIRIQLSPQKTTDNIEAIYKEDFRNGSWSYDLVYMDVIWLPKFVEKDLLKDLTEQISEQELLQFLKPEVKNGYHKKRLYRIPFRSDVGVLLYRKDLIAQAPKTFDDLKEFFVPDKDLKKQDKDLKKQEPWKYFWQGKEYEGLVATFCEVLSAYKGSWIDPITNKVKLDETGAFEAIKFLRSMIDENISPPQQISSYTEENSLADFQQGKAVFLRSWPNFWAKANADDSPIKGKVGMAQIDSAGCLGGWGFGIAKNAKHPKEAWQAIKFFTSEEVQRRFVLDTSYLPSRKALFENQEIIKKYPYFKEIKMLEQVENAVTRPPIEKYSEASEILQEHLISALFTRLNPKDVDLHLIKTMENAAEKTRKLLKSS